MDSMSGSEKESGNMEALDYQSAPIELQINDYAEIPFRNWLKAIIIQRGQYLKKQTIYSGAEINQISPTTARRYLEKMLSDAGDLDEFKDPKDRKKYVRFKQ